MGEINLSDSKIIKSILSRLGSIICVLIIVLNILYRILVVTEFSVAAITKITAEVVVYTVSVWTIYLFSRSNGNRDGKLTDIYKTSMSAYKIIREAVYCKVNELTEWCRWYVVDDLKKRKTEILIPNDIEYEDYNTKYRGRSRKALKQMGLFKWQIKAVISADKLKPFMLTARKLLTWHTVDTKNNHAIHPSEAAAKDTALQLSRYTICALFIVNISFAATTDTDIQSALMEVLLRTIGLIMTIFAGYKSGYRNQSVTAVNYTNEQTELLSLFHTSDFVKI